jgi:hypothetical protein
MCLQRLSKVTKSKSRLLSCGVRLLLLLLHLGVVHRFAMLSRKSMVWTPRFLISRLLNKPLSAFFTTFLPQRSEERGSFSHRDPRNEAHSATEVRGTRLIQPQRSEKRGSFSHRGPRNEAHSAIFGVFSLLFLCPYSAKLG